MQAMVFEFPVLLVHRLTTILSTARRHWAILLLLTIFFAILAPTVARLGIHGDDYCFIYASTVQDLSYFVNWHLEAAGRPFLAFLVYYLAILFSLSTSVTHLVQFAMHLGACVLLYALVIRLSEDKPAAAMAAATLALLPLSGEAVFWFGAGQYLVAALLLLLAAHASITPNISRASRRNIVFLLLFICVQFYELSATIALGLAAGLWLSEGKSTARWRQTLPAWVLGASAGFAFFMTTRYIAGYSRPLSFSLAVAKFLGPFRVFFGWTTQGIGLQWLGEHLWVLPGLVIILGTVVFVARRSDLQQTARIRPLLVPCILTALGGSAPFVFSSYFPMRALYPVAPWLSLALIILLHWSFRRAAWLPLLFILALGTNATFGTVSAYRHAILIQEQYLTAFQTTLPQWPAGARAICARNAPSDYGPISVFKSDWVLSSALAQEYHLDFEPKVYFSDRYPRCSRASPDITATWYPAQRQIEVELHPAR